MKSTLMLARTAIVTAARSQLGVKYEKDAEVPNVAMHCTGLLSYALQTGIGMEIPCSVGQGPIAGFTDARILDFIKEMGCEEIDLSLALPGDIVTWNYGPAAHHTGMISEIKNGAPWVIHSSAAYNKVAEHPLGTGQWRRRLNSVWSIESPLKEFLERES